MNNSFSLSLKSNFKNSDKSFIIFGIGSNKYAINIQYVAEVINILEIEIPQNTPSGIIGMFNYNNEIIKAVDLCPFLGLKTFDFSINNRLIVTEINGGCFAILVENIETVAKFDEKNIQNIPYSTENSILKEVYKSENGNINIINLNILCELISTQNMKNGKINYADFFPDDEKSKQILHLRTINNTLPQEIFTFPISLQSEKQYILFNLDNQNYYMDIKYIKEFISMKRLSITKLPYTPDCISGIVSVKGEFLLVVNLKRFLNKDNTNIVNDGKLIVVEGPNFNIAFLVDNIKYIKSFKDIQKLKMYSSNADYIYAEFMENNELYSILNFEKIINDERLYINIE